MMIGRVLSFGDCPCFEGQTVEFQGCLSVWAPHVWMIDKYNKSDDDTWWVERTFQHHINISYVSMYTVLLYHWYVYAFCTSTWHHHHPTQLKCTRARVKELMIRRNGKKHIKQANSMLRTQNLTAGTWMMVCNFGSSPFCRDVILHPNHDNYPSSDNHGSVKICIFKSSYLRFQIS